jgi:hypothetical protein
MLQDEAPNLGCGYRSVLCQFRRKAVLLHHAGYRSRMKREAFRQLVASNKRWRKRNAMALAGRSAA